MSEASQTVCSIAMIFAAIVVIPLWTIKHDLKRLADAACDLRDLAKGRRP